MSLAKFAPTPDVARLACLLERLVAIDTQNPPGREVDAAALLASELDAIGFATEVRPIAEGRANVVARIDNGAGPCFAFNSHTDTVPVGGGWTSNPFRPATADSSRYDARRRPASTMATIDPLASQATRATYGAARWC